MNVSRLKPNRADAIKGSLCYDAMREGHAAILSSLIGGNPKPAAAVTNDGPGINDAIDWDEVELTLNPIGPIGFGGERQADFTLWLCMVPIEALIAIIGSPRDFGFSGQIAMVGQAGDARLRVRAGQCEAGQQQCQERFHNGLTKWRANPRQNGRREVLCRNANQTPQSQCCFDRHGSGRAQRL